MAVHLMQDPVPEKEKGARGRNPAGDGIRVTVFGAGNGGLATAADLSRRGFPVCLYELPEFAEALVPVQERGGIELDVLPSTGLGSGFARLDLCTTDTAEAADYGDILLVVVPAFAQERFARALVPHLQEGQTVILVPGYLGSLVFGRVLAEKGISGAVLMGEMESLIYACRKRAPVTIWVRGYKHHLRMAALPARDTPRLLAAARLLYPELEAAENVLETGLSNANAIIHTPLVLLNGAHIERTGGDFLFYHEGMTPVVGRLIEALDRERLLIGDAFGLTGMRTIYRQDLGWYGHQGARGENIHDTHVTNPVYSWSKAPPGLDHRYVREDVPYGLVPMEDLAHLAGLSVPVMSSMIELFTVLTGEDQRNSGRTLAALGLDGIRVEELKRLVDETGWVRP